MVVVPGLIMVHRVEKGCPDQVRNRTSSGDQVAIFHSRFTSMSVLRLDDTCSREPLCRYADVPVPPAWSEETLSANLKLNMPVFAAL